MSKILELRGAIREYAWGSPTFFAQTLGIENPEGRPQAELWMGAHCAAPSEVYDAGAWTSLAAWIAEDPGRRLGANSVAVFGDELPFLFKLLAAAQPLSLQAHPDAAQARLGFEREERAGLALDDARRNYRDPHSKPELLCALTPFDALLGFRAVEDVIALFGALELDALRAPVERLSQEGAVALPGFFAGLCQGEGAELAQQVAAASASRSDHEPYRWVVELAAAYPRDIGIVAPLLLNGVHLEPGQAVFQPAGELHSYLRGNGIELMGNSDNVLRGGLTSKHVDAAALCDILSVRTGPPQVLDAVERAAGEFVYPTPAQQFELARLEINGEYRQGARHTIEILLCVEGSGEILSQDWGEGHALERGRIFLVSAETPDYRIQGEGRLFRASLPAD